MGQNIAEINTGSIKVSVDSTDRGGLRLTTAVEASSVILGQSISTELSEASAHTLYVALGEYIASRELKFEKGDIVYEPNHYKRAGEVIHILQDRIYYGAPYHIRFIDQDPNSPDTDYFAAEDLVLVQKKANR